MAKLVFSVIESLDGYAADQAGGFDWAEPDESVHTFVNDLERPVGTYLYGRRMYGVMSAWETMGKAGDQPPFIEDYANIWRAASKIVYSTTLDAVRSSRTRIERTFDPEAIRRMKAEAIGGISVGGPTRWADALHRAFTPCGHLDCTTTCEHCLIGRSPEEDDAMGFHDMTTGWGGD